MTEHNSIWLEVSREAMLAHLEGVPHQDILMAIRDVVHEVAPFRFRVLDEIRASVRAAEVLGVPWQEAPDRVSCAEALAHVQRCDPRRGRGASRSSCA